jgi:hypothetical protein
MKCTRHAHNPSMLIKEGSIPLIILQRAGLLATTVLIPTHLRIMRPTILPALIVIAASFAYSRPLRKSDDISSVASYTRVPGANDAIIARYVLDEVEGIQLERRTSKRKSSESSSSKKPSLKIDTQRLAIASSL